MSPQRSATTGKPLKLATGAPMRDCCCGGTPVDCGDCDPPLDSAYDVTLSGITYTGGADWRVFNGTWTVLWTSECTWYGEWDVIGLPTIDLKITLRWDATNEHWEVIVQFPGGCHQEHQLDSANPCDTPPPGDYTFFSDFDSCGSAVDDLAVSVA